jgi:hypothetical protein
MTTEERLAEARQELEDLNRAYKRALTAQSWQTKDGDSTRSVTNANIQYLASLIKDKRKEISLLEDRLEGRSHGAYRIGVKW